MLLYRLLNSIVPLGRCFSAKWIWKIAAYHCASPLSYRLLWYWLWGWKNSPCVRRQTLQVLILHPGSLAVWCVLWNFIHPSVSFIPQDEIHPSKHSPSLFLKPNWSLRCASSFLQSHRLVTAFSCCYCWYEAMLIQWLKASSSITSPFWTHS